MPLSPAFDFGAQARAAVAFIRSSRLHPPLTAAAAGL